MGVVLCGQPILIIIILIGTAVCAFMNIVQYYSSAADTIKFLVLLQITWMIPFRSGMQFVASPVFGGPSLKKWTVMALICAFDTERYEA